MSFIVLKLLDGTNLCLESYNILMRGVNLTTSIHYVFSPVIFVKIKVPHPSHPSTRISIQVPCLGIHFSPTRYYRLMELLNTFYGTMPTSEPATESLLADFAPWNPPDLATEARVLVWKVFPCWRI